MQEARPGIQTKVRVVGGGAARATEAGLGTRARGGRGVSEVAGDAAESGMGGEISHLEIRGIAGCERIERARRGCVSDAREGMARWAARIH